MTVRAIAIAFLALATLVLALPAGARRAQPIETLRGEVGPGFTIFLRRADGTAVTHLDPGEYQIVVDDKAIEHNFHLLGAGVDQFTQVETTGTATWTVTFADAQIYRYQCDPHATTMRGSFTVGNVPPPPPPPPPAPARLSASVTRGAIAVRTASGAKAKRVRAGSYRLAVRDTAKNQNFHLVGPGVNRKTTVRGTARATWSLRLRAGTYRYRSDSSRLRGSFRVG
jgi:copper binding plastocyanin/azurin family protein